MRVMAQLGMVMNLDKCIGCHTCSVTCKQAWTNRAGVEYVWFNNVETRPGLGYPRRYEDQQRWRGGWTLNRRGRLKLRAGGRLRKLLTIFSNPTMPGLADYYEPWTYDYDNLISSPATDTVPVARPKSMITGRDTAITWSANWDDDLGGAPQYVPSDPMLAQLSQKVTLELEQAFMFYLPRICEHCLNPSCVASCPSGAMYKRTEDGIVLVDQDRCRGWRMCVTGCPYKKVYFNHRTGKAEKCTLCYPRLEVGQPTVCSETCVGRLRYLGLFLYDADQVARAASVRDETELLAAQLGVLLDPDDPDVVAAARRDGIPDDWIDAARRSPVYKLACEYRIALPLHPEYRTMPMVWYVPPLSPMVEAVTASGNDGEDADVLFAAIDKMRIPVEYLAGLLSAGDTAVVTGVLRKLAAMRSFMRADHLGDEPDESIPASVGMTGEQLRAMYRLLAIAKYDERYVIPPAHMEAGSALAGHGLAGAGAPGVYRPVGAPAGADEPGCSLDVAGGPGMGQVTPVGELRPSPAAVENFHLTRQRMLAARHGDLPEGGGPLAQPATGGPVRLPMPTVRTAGARRDPGADPGEMRGGETRGDPRAGTSEDSPEREGGAR